jgi:hypothetical protein
MVGIYARTFHLKVLALADAPPARTMCKVPQSAATCRIAKLAVLAHAATQHVGLPTQLEGTLKRSRRCRYRCLVREVCRSMAQLVLRTLVDLV